MTYGKRIFGVDASGEDIVAAAQKLSPTSDRGPQLVDPQPWLAGTATGGSGTTLVDNTKAFDADVLKDKVLTFHIGTKRYVKKITANTADTITFASLGGSVAVVAGVEYNVVDVAQNVIDVDIESVTATDVTIRDSVTAANKLKVNADGSADVKLTGSSLEQYGASLATRPAANTVPAGTTFTVVGLNSLTVTISDGANWRAI